MSEPAAPEARAELPRGPVLIKVLAFGLALTLLFTVVANILPQVEGEAPAEEEVDLGSMTMDDFVALGESIFRGKGTCTLCHRNQGRAPDLLAGNTIETANERLADARYRGKAKDGEAYLRESMLVPSAYVVKGFGKKGSNDAESPMPAVDKPPIQLSPVEVAAVVAFLQAKDGNEVTVALPEAGANAASAGARSGAAPSAEAPSPAATPEAVVAKFGCAACHTVMGTESPVGPSLEAIGARLDAAALRESIVEPGAVIAEGFPAGMMPANFATRMTVSELELLVDWLERQK